MRFSGHIYGHSFFSCIICLKLVCAEFVAFWSSIILFGHEKLSISSDDKEEATNQSQDPVVYHDICPLSQHELPHQEFVELLFAFNRFGHYFGQECFGWSWSNSCSTILSRVKI